MNLLHTDLWKYVFVSNDLTKAQMKTIVITGSTRGLGFELAKCFRRQGFNIVINGVNEKRLESSLAELRAIKSDGAVTGFRGSVTETDNINAMIKYEKRCAHRVADEQKSGVEIYDGGV